MSMMRCEHCSNLIDTDEDVECFTRDERGRYGEGPCLCENCRDDYYCEACGEMPAMDNDTFCMECHPAPFKYNPLGAAEADADSLVDNL